MVRSTLVLNNKVDFCLGLLVVIVIWLFILTCCIGKGKRIEVQYQAAGRAVVESEAVPPAKKESSQEDIAERARSIAAAVNKSYAGSR